MTSPQIYSSSLPFDTVPFPLLPSEVDCTNSATLSREHCKLLLQALPGALGCVHRHCGLAVGQSALWNSTNAQVMWFGSLQQLAKVNNSKVPVPKIINKKIPLHTCTDPHTVAQSAVRNPTSSRCLASAGAELWLTDIAAPCKFSCLVTKLSFWFTKDRCHSAESRVLACEKMRNESTSTEHKVKHSPFSTAQYWSENTVERLKCIE